MQAHNLAINILCTMPSQHFKLTSSEERSEKSSQGNTSWFTHDKTTEHAVKKAHNAIHSLSPLSSKDSLSKGCKLPFFLLQIPTPFFLILAQPFWQYYFSVNISIAECLLAWFWTFFLFEPTVCVIPINDPWLLLLQIYFKEVWFIILYYINFITNAKEWNFSEIHPQVCTIYLKNSLSTNNHHNAFPS